MSPPNKSMPVIDWTRIEASAPGKFIISGEYSVVYEKQAIASAIDLRTKVTIRPHKDGKVRLHLKNLNYVREWPAVAMNMCRLVSKFAECLDFNPTMPAKLNHLLHARYLAVPPEAMPASQETADDLKTVKENEKKADDAAIAFLLLYIGLGDSFASSSKPSINVEVDSEIPVGAGLGSSSAFSVAVCGALMKVFRVSAEKYIISNWAFNVDKFFHGRPSGVDNNIIAYGGHILFQNGKIKATGVHHTAAIRVMLIDTGVSRSTKVLGERVATQLRDDPTKINSIFNNINQLTTLIWTKINDPSFAPKNIAVHLQANQELLDSLGVGHPKLTDICSRAQRLNLTAKMTGAGGGGSAFVLYDDSDNCRHISELRDELREAGYTVRDHLIGCDGFIVNMELEKDKTLGSKY